MAYFRSLLAAACLFLAASLPAAGSFNTTISAENQNHENLVILDCPDLARSFASEWEAIRPDEP